jgi:dienelactone hydrolase
MWKSLNDRPDWLDEVRKPPASVPASATEPPPVLFDERHEPINTPDSWFRRREVLSKHWTEFLGSIPRPAGAPVLEVLEEDRRDGAVRQLVRYETEPGLPVEGYLLRPSGESAPRSRPGVVVLHSTIGYTIRQPAGLEGPEDKHIGLHLARLGHVTFCPRCFLWQYGGEGRIGRAVDWLRERHPEVSGMAKMLYDAVRAVDLLEAQPDVDPLRLGAIGHSLGAKEALYLAAFDPRVRATVASEGGIGLGYSNWDAPWYLGPAVKHPGFPLEHESLLALVAPRAFLIVGGDSADGDRSWPFVKAVAPLWSLLGAGESVGLLNHRQGHSFPPEAARRSYEWLGWFLRPHEG